jgi:hypothetical protein
MLKLPDVTLVSINTVCHELTNRAIEDCLDRVEFGDVKLFTDQPKHEGTVEISPFANQMEAGEFTVYEVPQFIKTSHALFIHWDSWVIDPAMWTDTFLKCDYIGAPWWYQDAYNVGNSGFCLRSKRLIDFMAANREEFPLKSPEDVVLCREYQPRLPQFNWAPVALASQFSFERSRPSIDSRHFGFHGMFNWPFVLPPDKLAERMAIARKDPHIQKSTDLNELDGLGGARWLKVGNKITTGV